MPSHNHAATVNVTLPASSDEGDSETPVGNVPAAAEEGTPYATAGNGANMAAPGVTATIANNGSNQPVENRQPYRAINYIICMQGIFPSRS